MRSCTAALVLYTLRAAGSLARPIASSRYADVCRRILTYADGPDVCRRMLAYADIAAGSLARPIALSKSSPLLSALRSRALSLFLPLSLSRARSNSLFARPIASSRSTPLSSARSLSLSLARCLSLAISRALFLSFSLAFSRRARVLSLLHLHSLWPSLSLSRSLAISLSRSNTRGTWQVRAAC